MSAVLELLRPAPTTPPMRRGLRDLRDDLGLLRDGVLDLRSLLASRQAKPNPVELVARSPHDDGTPCHPHDDGTSCAGRSCTACSCGTTGRIKALRYTHNLRTNQGGDWQAYMMGGRKTIRYTNSGGTVTYAATTLTDTAGGFSTTANITGGTGGLAGQIVVSGAVFAIIISNTATGLTVERWINAGNVADTTGSTPSAGDRYVVLEGAAPAYWLGLTNDSTAINSTDTNLPSELTSNGFARAIATFAHSLLTASAGSTQTTIYTYTLTFTATGGNTSAQQCGIFLTSTVANNFMFLHNTFTAISGLISGDTLAVTWTVNA